MSQTYTRAELRTRIRQRSDMENSTFVTDTELNGLIDTAYARLYGILARKGLNQYESTQTITADGSSTYALASDYLGTLGIDYQFSSNEWIEVPMFQFEERNAFNLNHTGYARGYRVVGSNVELLPAPGSGTYRHLYIPRPAKLSSDATTVDGVNGWEELVVIDGAITCRMKEESSVRELRTERKLLIERIEEEAMLRNAARPLQIADMNRDYENDPWHRWNTWP